MNLFNKRLAKSLANALALTLISLIIAILVSSNVFSFQADSSVNYRMNKEGVQVLSYRGNYDKDINGKHNFLPRRAIANELYRENADVYDFIVVFSTFEFDTGDAAAFYNSVKNDTQGIGGELFDNTSSYGSDGRLQGYIDMVPLSRWSTDPLEPQFEETLATLGHEVLHRWSAKVTFDQGAGPDSSLLGKDGAHWSNLLDSDASLLYGHDWRSNGNGSFTSTSHTSMFSALDLYLAGLYKPSEVPPMNLIENTLISHDIIPSKSVLDYGQTISGSQKIITIEDIIAAEGERFPSYTHSQKRFNFGFVLLTRPSESVIDSDITAIKNIRRAFIERFSIWTGGRATAHIPPQVMKITSGSPSELMSGDIRLDDAVLLDGFSWLRLQQKSDGSWSDKASSSMRDTSVSLGVLNRLDPEFNKTKQALNWMLAQEGESVDSIARKLNLIYLLGDESEIQSSISILLNSQNDDGGWGIAKGYASNSLDTALALNALKYTKSTNAIKRGATYLVSNRYSDGGWGNRSGGGSNIFVSTTVLQVLKSLNEHSSVEHKAIQWLVSKQQQGGGFGDVNSTPQDTANVIKTVIAFGQEANVELANSAGYLLVNQGENGSWGNSTYATAVTLDALQQFSFFNWSLSSDITFGPETPVDGDRVLLTFNVTNNTNLLAPIGKVHIYSGDPKLGGKKISEDILIPELGAGTTVKLSYLWDTSSKVGNNALYIVVDPDNNHNEMSELDNIAKLNVEVKPAPLGVEVAVTSSEVFVSPNNPNMLPQNLSINATVRNLGALAVSGLVIQLRKGSVFGDVVDSQLVDISDRSSKAVRFDNQLTQAGLVKYFVVLDPNNIIQETNKSNNIAMVTVTTQDSFDLAVNTTDLTINDSEVTLGSDINFNVKLHNKGTNNSPPTKVSYRITNGETTKELQVNQIQIPAGQTIEQNIAWRVNLTGELVFSVSVDDTNQVPEINELNNIASIPLHSKVSEGINLTISHQDLTFSPALAKQGKPIHLSAEIRNVGNQSVDNIEVGFYFGDPRSGGELIGLATSAGLLEAGRSTNISFLLDSITEHGEKLIYAVIDPNNNISEYLKTDNSAFNVLEILSLPDLTLSHSDIQMSPSYPKTGDEVTLNIRLANLGQQEANNVKLRAYNGDPSGAGVPLSEYVTVDVRGKSTSEVSVNLGGSLPQTSSSLFVVVDENNLIEEADENNNTAQIDLVIQNGNFVVSQKYISPNGDDIQDGTDFYFRLKSKSNIEIVIKGSLGEEVKLFTSPQFKNVEQGHIYWDGRGENGRVLADGMYSIEVQKEGVALGSANVEIDTNRASMIEALNTSKAVFNNVTCGLSAHISGSRDALISKNGQKAYFTIETSEPGDLYPPGFYQMDINGSNIEAIFSDSFFTAYNLDISDYLTDYLISNNNRYVFLKARNKRSRDNEYWFADTVNNTTHRLPNDLGVVAGFSKDNLSLIVTDDMKVFVVPLDGSPRIEKIDLKQILSTSNSGSFQTHISPTNSDLMILDSLRLDGTSYILLADIATGALKVIYQGTAEHNELKVQWRTDGNGFVVIDTEQSTISVYNQLTELVTSHPLPKLSTGDRQAKVGAITWSPDYDKIAFVYFVNEVNRYQQFWIDSSFDDVNLNEYRNIGGVFIFEPSSGQLELNYEFKAIGKALTDDAESVPNFEPLFNGPTPGYNELIWPDLESLFYRSYRNEIIDSDIQDILVNEVWALDSRVPQKATPILTDFTRLPHVYHYTYSYNLNSLRLSPSYMLFESRFIQELDNSCEYNEQDVNRGTHQDLWSVKNTLNLLAELNTQRASNSTGISLSGTATDKNFRQYVLEYTPTEDPNEWRQIQPSSDQPVIDKGFATWLPPGVGSYYVRLSVSDLAGNQRRTIKRVVWTEATDIGNLYRSQTYISPNGDGIQDATNIEYLVMKPVHLEFQFFDEAGHLVREILRDHSSVGTKHSITWDGRDNNGVVLPDGHYTMRVIDFEFEFVIDNTPPQAEISLTNSYHPKVEFETGASAPDDKEIIPLGVPYIEYSYQDTNLDDKSISAYKVSTSDPSQFEEVNLEHYAGYVSPHLIDSLYFRDSVDQYMNSYFELVVEDLAGNKKTIQTPAVQPELNVLYFGAEFEKPNIKYSSDKTVYPHDKVSVALIKYLNILVTETVVEDIQGMTIEYQKEGAIDWHSEVIDPTWGRSLGSALPIDNAFSVLWSPKNLQVGENYSIRLVLLDQSGARTISNAFEVTVELIPKLRLEGWVRDIDQIEIATKSALLGLKHKRAIGDVNGHNDIWGIVKDPKIDHVRLYAQSAEDKRYSNEQFVGEFGDIDFYFLFAPHDLKECTLYNFRIEGIATTGEKINVSESLTTSCLSLKTEFIVENSKVCNVPAAQRGAIKFESKTYSSSLLKQLTLAHADQPDNVIFSINQPQSTENYELDTSNYPEGDKQFLATLTNVNGEKLTKTVVVTTDRSPPVQSIATPADGAQVCLNNEVVDAYISDKGRKFNYELSYSEGSAFERRTGKLLAREQGKRSVNGQIGVLKELLNKANVEHINGDITLRLKTDDDGGYLQCSDRTFFIDGEVAWDRKRELSVTPIIFSPNGDGIKDHITISYTVGEAVDFTIQVYSGSELTATLLDQQQTLTGSHQYQWDGTINNGQRLATGDYLLVFKAKDACGNSVESSESIFIDSQAPVITIDYPSAGAPLGMIIEVQGDIKEQLSNKYGHQLQHNEIKYGEGADPLSWSRLYSGTSPLGNPVTSLNTFGLDGLYTFWITATDFAGNTSEKRITVDIDNQLNLLSYFQAVENLFSPNGDNIREQSSIRFGLAYESELNLFIINDDGIVLRTLLNKASMAAGEHAVLWDGLSSNGNDLADGKYKVLIEVSLAENTGVKQEELISVELDATAPAIELVSPEGKFTSSAKGIVGSINDNNLSYYEIFLAHESSTPIWSSVASGTQNKKDALLSLLADYPEGNYHLKIAASDTAEIKSTYLTDFAIDNTSPVVKIISPLNGAFLSGKSKLIEIKGEVAEENPKQYDLNYALTTAANLITPIARANQFPLPENLFQWNIKSLKDGEYILELKAEDKAGLIGKSSRLVYVDNTPPVAKLDFDEPVNYIIKTQDILGTASDTNIKEYILEAAPKTNEQGLFTLYKGSIAVESAKLAHWKALPADGEYLVKLSVTDKAGNNSTAMSEVTVDTVAPAPPTDLVANIENTNVRLAWQPNKEIDLAGYIVYRGDYKVSDVIVTSDYLVQNAPTGRYFYSVKAIDHAGLLSKPAQAVEIVIDTTPPQVEIISPTDGQVVSSLLEIEGTAFALDDFKEFRLYAKPQSGESQLVSRSLIPVQQKLLAQWNTLSLNDGEPWTLRLEAEDTSGNIATAQVDILIDNRPPASPTGLAVAVNGKQATLSWDSNVEADLLGYIIYRNDNVANTDEAVDGELIPFAIKETSYIDFSLADGDYNYSVVAIDKTGNISLPSAVESITVETKAPSAKIVKPVYGFEFEAPLIILAKSEDLDIAEVVFQYKDGQSQWQHIATDKRSPFETLIDAKKLGWSFDTYQLRAIATDRAGNTDFSPLIHALKYRDFTAPSAVNGLLAQVTADDVRVTWQANTEIDLATYELYRRRVGSDNYEFVTAVDVNKSSFADEGLSDNIYEYYIVAIDSAGNISEKSNVTGVHIYTPTIEHPYTPTRDNSSSLSGHGIGYSVVSGEITSTNGTVLIPAFDTDQQGHFTIADIALSVGLNSIKIRLTDMMGNISRDVIVDIINSKSPSKPTGLTSHADGLNLTLDWEDNPESNILGYDILDRGESIIGSYVDSGTDQSALSYTSYSYRPSKVADGFLESYWKPNLNYAVEDVGRGQWISLAYPSKLIFSQLEIDWYSQEIRAVDFDVQAWTGKAWITISRIRNNKEKSNTVKFDELYYTNRLRVYLLNLSPEVSTKQPLAIRELRPTIKRIHGQSNYSNTVKDGIHQYQVTAINTSGFVSEKSKMIDASIGDIIPPEPVELSYQLESADVLLSWTASASDDLMQYQLYRNEEKIALISDISILDYRDIGRANGSYQYVLKAVDNVGNKADSNTIDVSIYIAPPQAPHELVVSAPEQGEMLHLTWQSSSPMSNESYQVLRSDSSNGNYEIIAQVNQLQYLDQNLVNGKSYYYVVIAIDELDNSSAYSQQTSGYPADLITPMPPTILSPTTGGKTIQLDKAITTITGFSEHKSSVQLYRKENIIATTEATVEGQALPVSIENGRLSPNGKYIVSKRSNEYGISSLILLNLENNEESVLETLGGGHEFSIQWGQKSEQITYIKYREYGNGGVVKSINIKDGNSQDLTDVSKDIRRNASVSPDQRYLVATTEGYRDGGLWLYDIVAKKWLTRISEAYPHLIDAIEWSFDSQNVSFMLDSKLHYFNLPTEVLNTVAQNLSSRTHKWSPTHSRLLYEAFDSQTAKYQIIAYHLDSDVNNVIVEKESSLSNAIWAVEGDAVLFVDAKNTIKKIELSSNIEHVVYQATSETSRLQLATNGELLAYIFNSGTGYHIIRPRGYFSFNNIGLVAGDNYFSTVATDSGGNTSEQSKEMLVTHTISGKVDFSIAENTIRVLPENPQPGGTARIIVTIQNQGEIAAYESLLSVWAVVNDQTTHSIVNDITVAPLASGESQNITIDWDLTNIEGAVEILAIVDPDNAYQESNESNNITSRKMVIANDGQVTAEVFLDSGSYTAEQVVSISANLKNNGAIYDGVLEVKIEDLDGYLVSSLLRENVSGLDYSQQLNFPLTWSPGSVLSGQYQVRVNVYNSVNELLYTKTVPFSVLADSEVSSTISTDKSSYQSNSNVAISGKFEYLSGNLQLTAVTAMVQIFDASQNLLTEQIKVIPEFLPTMQTTINFEWDSSLFSPGKYTAVIMLKSKANPFKRSDTLLSTSSTSFDITPSQSDISGTLLLKKFEIDSSDSVEFNYTIINEGNADISALPISVSLVALGSDDSLGYERKNIDIAFSKSVNVESELFAGELSPGRYNLILQAEVDSSASQVQSETLATKVLHVVDRQAPVISIVQPTNNEVINSLKSEIVVNASDELSDISSINVKFDAQPWVSVTKQQSEEKFSELLMALPDGAHELSAKTQDSYGNFSSTAVVSFVVDNTPPLIAFENVVGESIYNRAISPVVDVIDPNLSIADITLNGKPYKSGSSISEEGNYVLSVLALDEAGNVTQQHITFTLDFSPLTIHVTGVIDGLITNQQLNPTIRIESSNILEQSITLNFNPYISGTTIGAEGEYLLDIQAKNTEGHKVVKTFAFEIDKTVPIITIIGLENGGTYTDGVKANVSFSDKNLTLSNITLNGNPYHSGTEIKQPGAYQIDATAQDAAGNKSGLSVSFDVITPSTEIDISGVRDGDLTNKSVTPVISFIDSHATNQQVTLNGASFASGTTITTEGTYLLHSSAINAAAVAITKEVAFEIDKTAPVIKVTGVLHNDLLTESVIPVISVRDQHLENYEVTLNGQQYTSGFVVSISGNYKLHIQAQDKAGNSSSQTIEFILKLNGDEEIKDSDGDGIADYIETSNDSDGDGTPNYLDLDSDGDTLPDQLEGELEHDMPLDTDADGIPNYLDTDSDNDGVSDGYEADDGNGDGVLDYKDATNDSDKDGVPNRVEMHEASDPLDISKFIDSDNDGISDYEEITIAGDDVDQTVFGDLDVDSNFDSDADKDSLLDKKEAPTNPYADYDTDGVPAYLDQDDKDADIGAEDTIMPDFDLDQNGLAEFQDPTNSVYLEIAEDSASSCGQHNANDISVSVEQLSSLHKIRDVNPEYEANYQQVILEKEDFHCPLTLTQVQDLIDDVNRDLDDYMLPVVQDDREVMTAGTTSEFNVLENDKAFNDGELRLVGVSVDIGSAFITKDKKHIGYTPPEGFGGEVKISYSVIDSRGERGQGYLFITVNNKVAVTSGGSMNKILFALLLIALFRRLRSKSFLLYLLLMVNFATTASTLESVKSAGWYAITDVGSTQTITDREKLNHQLRFSNAGAVDSVDLSGTSWGIGAGYQWTPWWGVEVTWRDLGDRALLLDATLSSQQLTPILEKIYPQSAQRGNYFMDPLLAV